MSISAMKQALRVLNHIQMSIGTGTATIHCDSITWHDSDAAITALRQAIEQAEQIVPSDYSNSHQQEPVAWIVDGKIRVRLDMAGKLYYSETNVYAAPPQREWVELTFTEYMEAIKGKEDIEDCWTAIEAKLKEKNT